MNINKEVEKYNAKKEALLNNLVSKLTGYGNKLQRAISNIDNAISDLMDKKVDNSDELDVVIAKLKEVK